MVKEISFKGSVQVQNQTPGDWRKNGDGRKAGRVHIKAPKGIPILPWGLCIGNFRITSFLAIKLLLDWVNIRRRIHYKAI